MGVKRWLEKRGAGAVPEKRPGVTISRRDLIAVPVPAAHLLWRDRRVREGSRTGEGKTRTQNVLIKVLVEGVDGGKTWACGLEFDYANEESFCCLPVGLKYRASILPVASSMAPCKVNFGPMSNH